MERGKRYYEEPKLNIKKVIAVVVAILVIIMFVVAIKKLISDDEGTTRGIASAYFPVYTNGGWGVIDDSGKIVIEPTYEEYIIIPNNKKDVFICTYGVDYDANTYKTKVLNANGNEIISGYELVQPIYNYDESNNVFFEDNVLVVQKDGKYGMVDYSGNVLLDCKYENIEAVKGIENSFIIKENGKEGLSDSEGKIIIKAEYKEIRGLGDNYQNGYIVVNTEGKYGVIDFTGNQVIENSYEDIADVYGNGMYVVKDKTYKLIDKAGKTILDNFDSIKSINGENIIVSVDGKYGVKNIENEELISTDYQDLIYAFSNYYIAKKDGKYGVVDTTGKTVLKFKYQNIAYREVASFFEAEKSGNTETIIIDSNFEEKLTGYLSEVNTEKGYFRIKTSGEYKYYNFKFEEKSAQEILTNNTLFLSQKDDKYGYTDKNGNVVVDYIYDDAREQNAYGFVAVKKDGLWGSLDADGKIVAEPKYSLESNVYESFIGKWHISEDLNAYYYTDK